MKNILFALFIIPYLTVFSQDSKFGFSINSGISYSIPYEKEVRLIILDAAVDGGTRTNYNSNQNYFVDFHFNYNFNNKQSLIIGLSYVKYSLTIDDYQLYKEQKGSLVTNYLNIPLLFNQRYSETSSFSISFGPYVGILMNAIESGTSYTDEDIVRLNPNDPRFQLQKEYRNNISDDYQSTDFGLLIQQNFEIKIHKSLFLTIFGRYNLGLMDVISSDIFNRKAEYSAAERWYNNYASFGGGIRF